MDAENEQKHTQLKEALQKIEALKLFYEPALGDPVSCVLCAVYTHHLVRVPEPDQNSEGSQALHLPQRRRCLRPMPTTVEEEEPNVPLSEGIQHSDVLRSDGVLVNARSRIGAGENSKDLLCQRVPQHSSLRLHFALRLLCISGGCSRRRRGFDF